MSGLLLIIITVIYFICCVDQLSKGDVGHSLMFFSYCLANIGLMMVIK